MADHCRRCGAIEGLFPIDGALYCRPCTELSFRAVSRFRLYDRRDPQRDPRGYGRRWTDILTEKRQDS